MLADVSLHSASTALHYYLGSGSAAPPVPVTHINHSQSVLAPTSGSVTVGA
jgi:hypothetical protein